MSASAKKLHPDFIEEVTQRIDIVDVISDHIKLKKRGKDYLGLCPFHNERTPSFSVSPNKGLAYCFGCRWGGNAVKFLMELGRISFSDAVLELARSVGVQIRYEDGSTHDLPASSLQFKASKTPQKGASEKKICHLDLPNRDAAYRKLSEKLDLSLRHREKLRRDRHLSDAQINFAYQQGWVRTWQPGNNYHGMSSELAGIDPKSGRLTGVDGIAIAALDPTNQITGFQLAPDNREKFGKYIWVSSNNQGGSSPHLPNGELPIFCWRHPDAPLISEVWLCEGALKSLLVALRLWFVQKRTDVVVIGSVSSARYGEKTLHDYLAQLGAHAIRLMPDAGAVANPGISSANEQTLKWVQQWGYCSSVGWWGQDDKSDPDIDELEDWGAIAYISPEEFYAIAQDHGGYTPSVQQKDQEPSISRDEWELKFGFGRRLRERVKRTLEGFRGFGKLPTPKPKPDVAPDQLFQDANQRQQVWRDAVNRGYKYILDASSPGLGKSHAAGIALPEAFGVAKLWCLANDHRNPTTGVIEGNYIDLPVRHNGLKIDDSRKTPNGNPFLVWPKPDEKPDTLGNCPKTDLFQKFRAKNLNFEAAEDSLICQTCNLAYLCKKGSGQKYGASFRGDRRNVLAANRIRAHADSMPSPTDFDYSISAIIWDEVGTQLKPMDSVTVSLGDFDQVWSELEGKAPHLHEQLKPLRMALRPLLTGEAKQPFHGWDDSGVKALLPEKPSNLDAIIYELEEVLQPDLDFLEETPDSISDAKELSKAQQRIINREFRRQAHENFNNAFGQLALNWLVPFLKVWDGERGAFRCEWQKLTIFTKSDRHTSVARSAKFNIFLDATIDRERLALLLGIDPEEIYVVGQETPNHGNLRLIQITGMGKLGKDRSDSLKHRVAALKKALEERYPGIVFGDWKGHADAGDGRWFVNLRGSNEFQAAPALAVFGIPYQNVGHLQALYQTLTGEFAPLDRENPHSGLQRFIEAHVRAEIEQAVGRLRSHLRPNEQLTFLFVGDYNLSFLGMPVEQVEAFQICPEAGTDAQITRWKILEAVRLLHDQSQKLTQVAIATLIGKSQELVSKIASEFGGWKRLKKILLVLLNPPSSGSNIFSALTDDERWLAQTYLPACLDDHPEDAVEQIGQLVQLYGIKQFLRLLSAAIPQTQARLLALLLQSLPFHTELVELLEGGVP
jgi:hypothetical protein